MSNQRARTRHPKGLTRLVLRAPIWLYRARLGWVLGRRFLQLRHKGRKSGLERRTVLEVAGHDPVTNVYLVASGWGKRSDWYQNILKEPEVFVQVGRSEFAAKAVPLSAEESGQAMVDYADAHPSAARGLMRTLGITNDGSVESYRQIGRDLVPFVAFRPR